jgi:TetR/AcrR family transcriptional repressor of nem operon
MVGRPREFDEEQALDAAMEAFWSKGYEATSMADLMAATGLHKGSIYQAFGDKHSLFVQALNRYLAEMRETERSMLKNAATPLDGLRSGAHHVLGMAHADAEAPRGCLAVNALVELAPHDQSIKSILDDHMSFMRRTIGEKIAEAQAAGQISKEQPPEVLTAMMMTFMAGLAATIRMGLDSTEAHRLLDAQMDAIFLD